MIGNYERKESYGHIKIISIQDTQCQACQSIVQKKITESVMHMLGQLPNKIPTSDRLLCINIQSP